MKTILRRLWWLTFTTLHLLLVIPILMICFFIAAIISHCKIGYALFTEKNVAEDDDSLFSPSEAWDLVLIEYKELVDIALFNS